MLAREEQSGQRRMVVDSVDSCLPLPRRHWKLGGPLRLLWISTISRE